MREGPTIPCNRNNTPPQFQKDTGRKRQGKGKGGKGHSLLPGVHYRETNPPQNVALTQGQMC